MSAYLDHAATTPMRPEAVDAMLPFFDQRFANPSGAHRMARDARRAIDDARDVFAALIGARPGEVVFTSGGTESDNLAVFGAAGRSEHAHGNRRASSSAPPSSTTPCSTRCWPSADEPWPSTPPAASISSDLATVLEAEAARAAAGESAGVRLVSLMAANNEVGTIQPLAEAAEIVRRLAPGAVLHTDAVQAFCWTDVAELCSVADLVSLSAHKFGGPKGAGVLVVRDGVALAPRQLGGGQERGHRSGTQNVRRHRRRRGGRPAHRRRPRRRDRAHHQAA